MATAGKVDAGLAALARLDRAALRERWRVPGCREAVRRRRESICNRHQARLRAKEPSLLSGLLLDENGERLTPSHAVTGGVRTRDYVSRALIERTASPMRTAWRLPAPEIEAVVLRAIRGLLSDSKQMIGLFAADGTTTERIEMLRARAAHCAVLCGTEIEAAEQRALVRGIVEWVKVHRDRVEIAWRPADLAVLLSEAGSDGKPSGWTETLTVPVTLKARGLETRLVIGDDAKANERGRKQWRSR